MTRPRCLDLFCGGFGAGWGYYLAGYEVTGWDFVQRRDRPAEVAFVKGDVRDALKDLDYLRTFDLIHASPPCKVHTRLGSLRDAQGGTAIHGDMLTETREALDLAGVPYIIENVEGAPMRADVTLCGSMFGLTVLDSRGEARWLKRHRLFELGGWGDQGWGLQPDCEHPRSLRPLGIYGSLGDAVPNGGEIAESLDQARALMGIDWMSWAALTQAIPPAYTRYLGERALESLVLAS